MAKLNFLLLAGLAAKLAAAKDVYFNWNVTWVNASPDGFERPVIGINGQWPCPQIDVDVGDRLIVDVHNGLGNQSTGVHWHGFHQYSTGAMDGSTGVTQCPIPPGGHMQYHMQVNQTGTYWYHSHNMGQYPDGFRGALIVHDPKPPFQYDDEFTITLSDWHHEQMPDLLARYESQENQAAFGGREPVPNSALINDSTNSKIKVLPNKTYLVHIICLGNWPGHTWVFDGHEMTVVEVDGVYVEPYKVGSKMLRLATGQRYGVLIHTKPDASQNFAIWDTMDINMMFVYEHRDIPANYNPNVTAWLVYDESKPLPPPPVLTEFDFVDDVTLIPTDRQPILQPMHRQIIIDAFSTEIDGVARYTINNKTYIPPKVPTLYTANTVGPEYASDPAVYGQVNPFVVQYGEIVEIVINNHHNNLHPWHLHGHQFQVIQRSEVDGGYFTGHYFQNISHTPVRRDTIMVQNHGHAVIRFRADNPDKFTHARLICKKSTDIILRVWLLHCHIEWHVEAGLVATIIEAPETFPQSQQPPPQSHYDACAAYPQPHRGNAAGKNGTDLSGANTEVPTSDHGALYPEPVDAPAPAASTTSSAPPAPVASSTSSAPPAPAPQQQTPPPAPQQESPAPQQQTPPPGPQQESPAPQQQTPPPYSQPQPENTAAPKPKGHKKPPHQENYPKPDYAALPYHPNSPAAVNPEVVPAPQAQPAAQPAPQAAPVYSVSEPVQVEPEHPVVQEPPHDEPIVAHEHDSKGPWPKPHTDKAHAQIGDGSDGHPPTIADSQDTKGPWPNPHDDKTHAQVPDGPGGKPIIAHNEDNKGPWPNPHTNDQYVQEDGHVIKPSEDNGPNHLPEGYQYWEKYTN